MEITVEEKNFIKGYATALQDIMHKLTGSNGNSKSYDPCEFYDDETLHSYAFDLKDSGRRHSLSEYKDIDEIKDLMLKEAVEWCNPQACEHEHLDHGISTQYVKCLDCGEIIPI